VLLGVKDIFRADGFPTQAGSQLPSELFDGPEAVCVTRLKQAGALVLGKTVTTEFAYFEPGPTRNPHNTTHTPGGSSSGSAAAIATGMCQLALGTQTIGSVIRPAAFCGILGFKPSFGRIPTDGLIFFSRSADHVGFFTQDLDGLQLAASILCDAWKPEMDLQETLPVLGVPVGPYLTQASEEGISIFEAHLKRFEQNGYTIKRVQTFDDIDAINHRHRQLTAAEAAQEHAEWFANYQDLYREKTREVILTGQKVSNADITRFREEQLHLRMQLAHLQEVHGIDLWLSPSALGEAPEGLASTGNPDMNLPWTHAGLPAVTIPSGISQKGLPLGLQVVGTWMGDEILLGWIRQLKEV
jgi:Asp-tRNA(Asn)/Glu-tRNA(Gln) amidotransferase A subunit family amidase